VVRLTPVARADRHLEVGLGLHADTAAEGREVWAAHERVRVQRARSNRAR
jgi:hypothetical protein